MYEPEEKNSRGSGKSNVKSIFSKQSLSRVFAWGEKNEDIVWECVWVPLINNGKFFYPTM